MVAREVASRLGVGSGVGVGAGEPTVLAVKKSIARPSSRSAKIQPPRAIMSRWPPWLVRRRSMGSLRAARVGRATQASPLRPFAQHRDLEPVNHPPRSAGAARAAPDPIVLEARVPRRRCLYCDRDSG